MTVNEAGRYTTYRTEDIGRVDYAITHYGTGYAVVGYQEESGITATYRGKGSVWQLLSRGYKPSMVTDGRMIWRLAELALELDEFERAS